jgi:phosphatidylinositol phospholipase C beta
VLILFYIKYNYYYHSYSWMRLGFLTDPKGKVPVKVVARTFASGKTEKLVYQCLSDLGLPSGKVKEMRKH